MIFSLHPKAKNKANHIW